MEKKSPQYTCATTQSYTEQLIEAQAVTWMAKHQETKYYKVAHVGIIARTKAIL